MKRLLAYYGFIITSVIVALGFLTARDPAQLIGATLFYPLAVYFFLAIAPRRNKAIHLPKIQVLPKESLPEKQTIEEGRFIPGFDFDRRMFLKLIGSAGLSVFFFSLFTKKAEAAFFGSVPGPGTVSLKDTSGTKIDPAVKQPTDGYRINQLDDTSSATYSYFGFTNKDGDWFIMRETTSGANVGDYRYYKKKTADGSFSTEWPNRATLSPYDYFDVIF